MQRARTRKEGTVALGPCKKSMAGVSRYAKLTVIKGKWHSQPDYFSQFVAAHDEQLDAPPLPFSSKEEIAEGVAEDRESSRLCDPGPFEGDTFSD